MTVRVLSRRGWTQAAAVTAVSIILAFFIRQSLSEPLCRINDGPCLSTTAGVTVALDISPKPVRAMKELAFSVLLREGVREAGDAAVSIALTMPGMDMGRNVIKLKHASGGRYEGRGVIVRCPSGGRTWKASVTAVRPSGTTAAEFLFEVH